MRIDMHFHSLCSDGTETPARLARSAALAGLRLASLTDHDTIAGVAEFLREADRRGMRALAGIEMSATWPGTLHLLGYGFDHKDDRLCSRLAELQASREERNKKIFGKLAMLGIGIDEEDVARESGGGVTGRPHFAKALVRKGYARDMKDAFARYLGKGAPAYCTKESFPPEECIEMIRHAGGVVSLAHPYQTATLEKLRPLVAWLKELGLWGVECYSGHHDGVKAAALRDVAKECDLQVTGGSDFHGANRPGYHLGVGVPDDLIPWTDLGFPLPGPR